MIEILAHIANAQVQLGQMQRLLIEEQETPVRLEAAAKMARSIEDTSADIRKHLLEWADEMRNAILADELIASVPVEDPHQG